MTPYNELKSLLDLLLVDIYAAEQHLSRELKNFVDGAVSAEFRSQLEKHLHETEAHVRSVAELLKSRSLDPHEGKCRILDSLLRKGQEILQSRGDDAVLDLGLVFIMRKIDLLEQSSYEDAKTLAEAIGEDAVVKVLEQHIRDEGQHERSWVVLGEDMVDSLAVKCSAKLKQTSAGGTYGQVGI